MSGLRALSFGRGFAASALAAWIFVMLMFAGCVDRDDQDDNQEVVKDSIIDCGRGWVSGGTLTYAGQDYRTIIVGDNIWMAENLNYETAGSWCNDNNGKNCDGYGRLYAWDAAVSACAVMGWRLPDSADWEGLAAAAGGSGAAGRTLKSATGWKSNGNGIDSLGFSALPGGSRNNDGGFEPVGADGFWWSAAEAGSGYAWYRGVSYDKSEGLREERGAAGFGFSVRCVRPLAITVSNPYADVDWAAWKQYKASFHVHTSNSDGSNTRAEMLEDYYAKDFDIVTINDHDFLTTAWDGPGVGALATERKLQMEAGEGRGGRGMITIPNTSEHSAEGDPWPFAVHHINIFNAPFVREDLSLSGRTMAGVLAKVEEVGGVSHINHPGRYTGGDSPDPQEGAEASNNPAYIKWYADLFMAYKSCAGMEIINNMDKESFSDRILWDNINMRTIPQGRSVYGFCADDSHRKDNDGFGWNVMLMTELSTQATLNAMKNGEFYAVSRYDRREGVKISGTENLASWLTKPTPSISGITVNGGSITVTGAGYDVIEWIADGVKIATGSATLNIKEHLGGINSYVRAQLKSATGIAYTQPFGVSFGVND